MESVVSLELITGVTLIQTLIMVSSGVSLRIEGPKRVI